MPNLDLGTLTASIDANTSAYERAMLKLEAMTTATTKSIERKSDPASKAIDNLSKQFEKTVSGAVNLGAAMAGIKMASILSAIGPAITGIGALGGQAIVAGRSIADLGGSLAELPYLLGAVGQGAITIKLAFSGVSKAMTAYSSGDMAGFNKQMAMMPPATQAAVKQLIAMRPALEGIKNAASSGLMPGIVDGLKDMTKNIDIFKQAFYASGQAIGKVFEKFGAWFGSPEFKKFFAMFSAQNNRTISALGDMLLNVGKAVTKLIEAGRPFSNWVNKMLVDFGLWADKSATVAGQTGKLQTRLDRTIATMTSWGNIIKNLAGGIAQLFGAAQPASVTFLGSLEKLTERFDNWAHSSQSLGQFFKDIQGPMHALALFIGAFGKGLGQFFGGQNMTALTTTINLLTNKLLPIIFSLVANMGPTMINNVIELASALGKMVTAISFNPIMAAIGLVAKLVEGFSNLVNIVPGLGKLLGTITMIAVVLKTINFMQMASGMGLAVQMAMKFTVVQEFAFALQLVAARAATAGEGLNYMALSAKGALASMSALSKLGLYVVAGEALARVLTWVTSTSTDAGASVDTLAKSLSAAASNTKALQASLDSAGYKVHVFGKELDNTFMQTMQRAFSPSNYQHVDDLAAHLMLMTSNTDKAKESIGSLDTALAEMLTGGHGGQAKNAWSEMVAQWVAAGKNVDDLIAKFPEFQAALTSLGDTTTWPAQQFKVAATQADYLAEAISNLPTGVDITIATKGFKEAYAQVMAFIASLNTLENYKSMSTDQRNMAAQSAKSWLAGLQAGTVQLPGISASGSASISGSGGGGAAAGASPKSTAASSFASLTSGGTSFLTGLAAAVVSPVTAGYRQMLTAAKGFISGSLRSTLDAQYKALNSLYTKHEALAVKLATDEQNLANLQATKSQYAASTTSMGQSYGGIGSAWGDVQNQAPTGNVFAWKQNTNSGSSMLGYMQGRLTKMKTFMGHLASLRKLGLNDAIIQEIVAAGIDTGDQMALAILSDQKEIQGFNSTYKDIQSYATSMGDTAASWMYDAGIATAKGIVAGLKSQEKAIEAQMNKIAASMIAAIKKALGIKSPSTVMMSVGKNTVEGMAKGITSNKHLAVNAMTGVAKSVSSQHIIGGVRTDAAQSASQGSTSVSAGGGIQVLIDLRGANVTNDKIAMIEKAAKTGVNAALSKVAAFGGVVGN